MAQTQRPSDGLLALAQTVDSISPELAARALPVLERVIGRESFDASDEYYLELLGALIYQRARGRQVVPIAAREQTFFNLRRSLESVEPNKRDWFMLRWYPCSGWVPLDGPEQVSAAFDGLAWDLAEDFGMTSELITADPTEPGSVDDRIPSPEDRAQALRYALPAGAVLKAIAEGLCVDTPAVVERAFTLGCEDLLWKTEGRLPGQSKQAEA